MRPRAGEGWDPPPPGFLEEIGGRGAWGVMRGAWCVGRSVPSAHGPVSPASLLASSRSRPCLLAFWPSGLFVFSPLKVATSP
jgi:hypothetical protein